MSSWTITARDATVPDTFAGMGAVAIDGISVGSNSVVGAGSVVIRDVPDGARVVGVPARSIGRSD